MLSGKGLCDELITRPEESYRLCCVVVCDLETSRMGAPYIYNISRLKVNTYVSSMCIYIGLKTFFYVVRHLDSIASYLPTGHHLVVQCSNLKKIGKVLTSKFVRTGPSSYEKKKNLPGRGLTKVEKHWSRVY